MSASADGHLTSVAAFEDALREHADELLAVVFVAPWCENSHQLTVALPSLVEHFSRTRFAKVDVSCARELAAHCMVVSTPALLVYQHGEKLRDSLYRCDEFSVYRALDELVFGKLSAVPATPDDAAAPSALEPPEAGSTSSQSKSQRRSSFSDASARARRLREPCA